MTSVHILISVNTVAALWVIWSSICAANFMSLRTPWLVRLAYLLLGVGAAAALLAPGYLNRAPTFAELLLVIGLAMLSIGDRRRPTYQVQR